MHVLRDCPKSKEGWLNFNLNQFLFSNVESWITSNINSNFNVEYHWYVLFASIIWTIWKGRNDEVFNGKKFDPIFIVYQNRKTANEIYSAFDFSKIYLKSISPTVKLVKWNFPEVGKIKLHTDRSFIAC